MESFHWNKNFVTGLEDVDRQHQKLVEIINRFGSLVTENRIVMRDMDEILNELADYTRYHFSEEEGLMAQVGMDRRHLDDHIESHRVFLHEVTALHSAISGDDQDSARYLLAFLTHWLAYHILGTDQNMARQIKAVRSGLKPEEAYEAEERERDKATEPLLNALNGLFGQLLERNKELMQLNRSLEEKVAKRTRELSEANLHLEELSLTDVLTGLPNRRHAMRMLASLWAESVQNDLPLSCMMVDADHFKEVNDTSGHGAGDAVLTELANALRHSLRSDDIVCRLGGDEFLIICPGTDLAGGMHIAELTRRTVSALRVPAGHQTWHGSISVGVAARTADILTYEDLIRAADKAVYASKKDGRNCVSVMS